MPHTPSLYCLVVGRFTELEVSLVSRVSTAVLISLSRKLDVVSTRNTSTDGQDQ